MLQWIISSCVLIAVVLLLRLVLKGRISLRLQYALWALVLVRLLLPVSIGSSSISVSNFVPKQERTDLPGVNVVVDLPEAEDTLPPVSVEQLPRDEAVIGDPAEVLPTTQIQDDPVERPGDLEPAKRNPLTVTQIHNLVWGIGAVVVGLWFFTVNLRMHRRLRATRKPVAAENCSLPVYVTDGVDTPCLFGLLRPAIYLTRESLADPVTLRYALIHEQVHRSHGDHLWAILRCLCLAIHWYNPLVWLAALVSRRDAELACDEAVLRRLGEADRAPYGRALLQLTCRKRPALLSVSTTMTGSAKSIRERISVIVKKPKMAVYTLVAVLLIAAIAVGCTFTGAEKPAEQETMPPVSEDPTESEEAESQIEPESTENSPSTELVQMQITTPEETVYELFDAGGAMSIWLELADGGCTRAFSLEDRLWAENFASKMERFEWTATEKPAAENEGYYVLLRSPNGEHQMKIYPLEIQYENGEQTFCWQGTAKESFYSSGSLAKDIRREYDAMEERYVSSGKTSWSYAIEGTAEEAVKAYVDRFDPALPLTPGSSYAITDSFVIDWTIYSVSEDGNSVGFEIYYAFAPFNTDPDNNPLAAGGVEINVEKYGGMWTTSTPCMLQRSVDGLWHPGVFPRDSTETPVQSPATPKEAFALLYGDIKQLRMYLRLNNGEISPVVRLSYPAYYEILRALMEAESWEAVDPSEFSADGDCTVVLLSADGRHMLSASGDTLLYESEGQRLCWRETNHIWRSEEHLDEYLRGRIFNNEESAFSRISFSCEGTAEDAARYFVEEAFAEQYLNLTRGHWYAYSEYRLMDWEILQTNEEGTALVLGFTHAFVPANSPLEYMIIGNGGLGTGEYEGMVYTYREIVLRQLSDGKWYCVGGGTGGLTLRDGF